MNRWQRIKKDRNYTRTLNIEDKKLYDKVVKQINETNKRLKQLEKGIDINRGRYNPKTKRYERKDSYQIINTRGKKVTIKQANILRRTTGTWASKKLISKLDNYYNNKTKKIILPKNIDVFELRKISKTLTNFLKSKTSTLEGIKDVEETTKNSISNIVDDMDNIDNEDIETLYDFFNDSDFQDITQYIPPSDIYVILADSKSKGDNEESFLRKIEQYIDKDSLYSDSDMKNKLLRIYNKFNL